MNDPVAILKRDHREVAQMLKTLDSSKPGARRRQTVDKLTRELELHMEIEERDVYPVVQRVVGEEEAQ
jgi:hemerythrin-like domain-containing protein